MPKQPTKKYKDMTPEEQYEYRLTDNRGVYFNGVPQNMEEPEEEEPEEDEEEGAEDDSATAAKVKGRRGS